MIRAKVPCEVLAGEGDTLTPVEHCRRIAELAGGHFRRVRTKGGHMWIVIEPAAFYFQTTGSGFTWAADPR